MPGAARHVRRRDHGPPRCGAGDGCALALPVLGVVALLAAAAMQRVATRGHLLPEDQQQRIQELRLGLRRVEQGRHME